MITYWGSCTDCESQNLNTVKNLLTDCHLGQITAEQQEDSVFVMDDVHEQNTRN